MTERRLQSVVVAKLHHHKIDRPCLCRSLDRVELIRAGRRVPQRCDFAHIRDKVAYLLQPLTAQCRGIQKDTREVASRMCETLHITAGDRVAFEIVCEYRERSRC